MKRMNTVVAGWMALCWAMSAAFAQEPVRVAQKALQTDAAGAALDREQLNRFVRERDALNKSLEQRKQECYKKFAVTPCIQDAETLHNERLRQLKKEESAYNEEQRRIKADQRMADIQARQAEKERQTLASQEKSDTASLEGKAQGRTPKAAPTPHQRNSSAQNASHSKSASARNAQAQARRQQAVQRESERIEHRAKREQRLAQRRKPAAAPLPIPPQAK